jgi:lysophospholipase L1-like esterase
MATASHAQILDLPAHSKVLFQGDSITDMNRGRSDDPNHILGHSYVFLIAAKTGAQFPDRALEFVNRGASGEKVADLAARWQRDAIELRPTILSILVGINDVEANAPVEQFEATYDALLTLTKKELPGARIVICEPFGLPTGWRKSNWSALGPKIMAMQAVTERLAKKHKAIYVRLQKVFEQASSKGGPEYWIWDGIHPTYSGQQLIADAWVRAVKSGLREPRQDEFRD